ncbi:hypothetical protein Hanom_Chr05g00463411 [Helianthus anomalus]
MVVVYLCIGGLQLFTSGIHVYWSLEIYGMPLKVVSFKSFRIIVLKHYDNI